SPAADRCQSGRCSTGQNRTPTRRPMSETYTHNPLLTERFDRALDLAGAHHRRQLRKGTAIPYAAHLLAVARLGPEMGGNGGEAGGGAGAGRGGGGGGPADARAHPGRVRR